jgi:hypothetical protein
LTALSPIENSGALAIAQAGNSSRSQDQKSPPSSFSFFDGVSEDFAESKSQLELGLLGPQLCWAAALPAIAKQSVRVSNDLRIMVVT